MCREIRQDQVDAGLVVRREQHAAVDDQQPAQVLENGHVAADFADTAQRGDPQPAGVNGPGGVSSSSRSRPTG